MVSPSWTAPAASCAVQPSVIPATMATPSGSPTLRATLRVDGGDAGTGEDEVGQLSRVRPVETERRHGVDRPAPSDEVDPGLEPVRGVGGHRTPGQRGVDDIRGRGPPRSRMVPADHHHPPEGRGTRDPGCGQGVAAGGVVVEASGTDRRPVPVDRDDGPGGAGDRHCGHTSGVGTELLAYLPDELEGDWRVRGGLARHSAWPTLGTGQRRIRPCDNASRVRVEGDAAGGGGGEVDAERE